MIDFEQSILFITAAIFDKKDSEQLEPQDRAVLISSVSKLCEDSDFPDFDSVFLISENNCASLVSAHHMADILEEEYGKGVRYMLLHSDAWVNSLETLESIRAKDPFLEQLWVVVGSPQWMSLAVRALLPPKEEVSDLSNIPSGCVVGGYTYRKEELAWLYGHAPVSTSTRLN